MRLPAPRLICLVLAATWLASCQPGPTDPNGPIIRTPEPAAARSVPPRLAAVGDIPGVLPAPQCHRCADPAACERSDTDDVCLVQCSASGARRWDLGVLDDRQCDPAAANFCEANGLGRVTDSCWGGYS